MRRPFALGLAFASTLAFAASSWIGCSASSVSTGGADQAGGGGGGGAGGDGEGAGATSTGGTSNAGGSGGGIDVGDGGPSSGGPAHLKGKVVAPEGTIPIAGALVYFTHTPPPPIPDGVYCDKCVKLDQTVAYTTTNPDGTFELGTGLGDGFLVVQKGAFRRVRAFKPVEGDQMVPPELTRMPPKTDKAAGDDVPKIAVVAGAWDPIEVVLARMGLEAKISKNGFGQTIVAPKDATGFAIYSSPNPFDPQKPPYPDGITLLNTPSEIEKYHIVFIPCSGGTNNGEGSGPACDGVWYSGNTASTLEGFVKKGGRVYASDWSYEYVRQVFQGFVSWQGETQQIGSACQGGGGDQSATVEDPQLDAWLKAQGQSLDSVKDAWTDITGVHAKMDIDADGKPVNETPKVWVKAQSHPATTSFAHGCGRVLYTTYHTQPSSETGGALEPQALSLLYLILEVGVCIDTVDPK